MNQEGHRYLVAISRDGVLEAVTFGTRGEAAAYYDTASQQWSESFLCAVEAGPGLPLPDLGQVLDVIRRQWFDAGARHCQDKREQEVRELRELLRETRDMLDSVRGELRSQELLERVQEQFLRERYRAIGAEAERDMYRAALSCERCESTGSIACGITCPECKDARERARGLTPEEPEDKP